MQTTKLCVAIATAGRKLLLSETVTYVAECVASCQDLALCPAVKEDIDVALLAERSVRYRLVAGPRGLTAQRNALIDACDADLIAFLDDDFLPAPDFIDEAVALFAADPSIVAATGNVLADGIMSAGLHFEEALRILDAAGLNTGAEPLEAYSAYGCNMVFRMAPIRQHRLRFDEALPLYAWQEDVDFSRQVAAFGRVVKSPRLRGVHMGTKRSGRSPGKRLGYSQIANPIYLSTKGTVSWRHSLAQISRNCAANVVKSIISEPWTDHRGRLSGNLLALRDLMCGALAPNRILSM